MNDKLMWMRKCPNCNKELIYKTINGYKIAINKKSNCYSCSKLKENHPMWGKQLLNTHKEKISESIKGKNNPMFGKIGILNPNYGKKYPDQSKKIKGEHNPSKRLDVRKKLSETKKGKNNPMYGKSVYDIWVKKYGKDKADKLLKISNDKKSNSLKGMKRSEETKRKMRLSSIKRIGKQKFNGGQLSPAYNSNSCEIINWFNMYYDFNFQHAENGGEICLGGYFPDGLDDKRETIIEIDENHHFDKDGKLKEKDIKRQQYLENLGYKFIRIKP